MSKTEGFDAPNTTPVPDIVFDKLLCELTGNELKVLLYIIRRTYGFGKNADAISLSQFRRGIKTKDKKVLDGGCGLEHNRTILVALASLEQKGYVIANKGQTTSGDADTTIYKLRFKMASAAIASEKVVTSSNYVVTPGNEGSYSTSPPWLPQVTRVVTPGNPQETVLQETVVQQTEAQESNSTESVSESEAFVDTHAALAFSETESHSYRHDHTRREDAWNCHNWRVAHDGATCEDYQAWIESGGRDVPTDKMPAVKPSVAIASTPGEAASPPAADTRQSQTVSSPSPGDGAARGGKVTGPRASGKHTTPDSVSDRAGSAPPLAATPVAVAQMPAGAKKPKRKRTGVTHAPEELSPEVTRILDEWDSLHKKPVPHTEGAIKAARLLVAAQVTLEELKGCRDWLPTTDNPNKPWYRRIGVHLPDIAAKLGQYRSIADMPPPPGTVMEAQWEAALTTQPPIADGERRSDFDIYVGNGPEARRQLVEEGRRLKALGIGQDLPGLTGGMNHG